MSFRWCEIVTFHRIDRHLATAPTVYRATNLLLLILPPERRFRCAVKITMSHYPPSDHGVGDIVRGEIATELTRLALARQLAATKVLHRDHGVAVPDDRFLGNCGSEGGA